MENKKLYATITLQGDKDLNVVDEIRLAIHDADDNLIFATYWDTGEFSKEDIEKAINTLINNYQVSEVFTLDEIYPLEIIEENGEVLRVFRTKKIENA